MYGMLLPLCLSGVCQAPDEFGGHGIMRNCERDGRGLERIKGSDCQSDVMECPGKIRINSTQRGRVEGNSNV
jgi:hypothetical protein